MSEAQDDEKAYETFSTVPEDLEPRTCRKLTMEEEEEEAVNSAHDTQASTSVRRSSTSFTSFTSFTARQWLQILNSAVIFLNSWGLLLAFGAFQTYYEQVLLSTWSRSDISWISTVCAFLILVSGLLIGPLYDYGYFKAMIVLGVFLQVFGMMMISLSTKYYQLLLAQGICVGIGGGLVYIPSLTATAAAFEAKQRAKVMGLVASFIGVGGVVYPIMFRQLYISIGFPWTVRAMGFVVLGTYTLALLVLRYPTPKPSSRVRPWFDKTALTDWSFLLGAVSIFFSCIAYFVPIFFLPLYAETAIPNFTDYNLAFYSISILNAVSIVGRFSSGFIAARLGPIQTAGLAQIASAVLLFGMIGVHSTPALIVWCVLWGFWSCVIVAMPGAIIPLLTPDPSLLGTRGGMYWAFCAFGVLIGAPIGGALASEKSNGNVTHISWWKLQIFAAISMVMASICSFASVYLLKKKKSEIR